MKKIVSIVLVMCMMLCTGAQALAMYIGVYNEDGHKSVEFNDAKIEVRLENGTVGHCIFNTQTRIIENFDVNIDITQPCEIYIPAYINDVPVVAISFSALEGLYEGLPMWNEQIMHSKIYVPDTVKICYNVTRWDGEKDVLDNIEFDGTSFYCGYVVLGSEDFTICCTENSYVYKAHQKNIDDYDSKYDTQYIIVDSVPETKVTTVIPPNEYEMYMAEKCGYNPGTVLTVPATPDVTDAQTVTVLPTKKTVQTSFGATVSDWAAPEIEKAFENKLIPEVMIDFDLTEKVNRGEFAAIALQLYDVLTKSETGLPSSCPFNDISGDINEQAIKKAYGIQITAGTSNTTFEPISFITREQLATMLCRVVKKYGFKDWTLETDDEYYLNTTGAKIFDDDGDISDWAKPSVYFMSLYGIIQGVDETHFAPKNTTTQQEASGYASATREQAIILAQRIFTKQDMLKNF